jgi:hypothetical protein
MVNAQAVTVILTRLHIPFAAMVEEEEISYIKTKYRRFFSLSYSWPEVW